MGNKAGPFSGSQVMTIEQLCRAAGRPPRSGELSQSAAAPLLGRSTARLRSSGAAATGCRSTPGPRSRWPERFCDPAQTLNPTAGPSPRTLRPCCSGKLCPPRPLTGGDAQLLGAPAEALHHLPAAEVRQVPHGPALKRRRPGPAAPLTTASRTGRYQRQGRNRSTQRSGGSPCQNGRARAACPVCPPSPRDGDPDPGGVERGGAGRGSQLERGGLGRSWTGIAAGAGGRSGAELGGCPGRGGCPVLAGVGERCLVLWAAVTCQGHRRPRSSCTRVSSLSSLSSLSALRRQLGLTCLAVFSMETAVTAVICAPAATSRPSYLKSCTSHPALTRGDRECCSLGSPRFALSLRKGEMLQCTADIQESRENRSFCDMQRKCLWVVFVFNCIPSKYFF